MGYTQVQVHTRGHKLADAACSNMSGICVRGHECPSVSKVCRAFSLEVVDVLNVYAVGSHMWGTCTGSSDWDIVIIVQQRKSPPTPRNVHKGYLDAFVLSEENYKEQLDAHSMQVLLTLWLPDNCVLKQTFDPWTIFEFSEEKLMMSLGATRDRDLAVAEKHFRKKNIAQAKKVFVHCIRYLDIGVQMKMKAGQKGYITFGSSNNFREQVLSNYSQSWDEFIVFCGPIVEDLWSKIAMST